MLCDETYVIAYTYIICGNEDEIQQNFEKKNEEKTLKSYLNFHEMLQLQLFQLWMCRFSLIEHTYWLFWWHYINTRKLMQTFLIKIISIRNITKLVAIRNSI